MYYGQCENGFLYDYNLLALSIDVIRGNGNKKHQYSVPIHFERARTLFMVVKRG